MSEFYGPRAFFRNSNNQDLFLLNLELLSSVNFDIQYRDMNLFGTKNFWNSVPLKYVG